VRCPGCGAEVSALRDACPRCGASTDRAFDALQKRGRGDGRSAEELLRNRRTVGIIAGGILVLTLAMGNFHLFGRHLSLSPGVMHIDTGGHRHDPVTIGAAQLFEAYHTDSRAADRQYGDREMVVSGEFIRTVPDGYGSIDMRLKTNHPDIPLGIDLDNHSVDAATKLGPGQMVTVSCQRVAGSGDDPWLQDCVLQPAAPTGAAPVTEAGPPAPPAPPAAPGH
jgi:hypothetical protein